MLERGHGGDEARLKIASLEGGGRDQGTGEAHVSHVPAATTNLERGQKTDEAQRRRASLNNGGSSDHLTSDAHTTGVRTATNNFNGDHRRSEAHGRSVAVEKEQGSAEIGHTLREAHHARVGPADALLLVLADALDDIERTRIANENRLRSLTTIKGLDETDQASVRLTSIVDGLQALESGSTRALEHAMKAHPLGPWVKRTTGIGLKQAARLIAAIGDPTWNSAEDRPRRGPAELWAYCGYRPGQRRQKGLRDNWNATAKMRARLCAESCVKQRSSPYRPVYDRARAAWSAKDTTDLHKHNHGLRLVAKAILKDLFLEARRITRRS